MHEYVNHSVSHKVVNDLTRLGPQAEGYSAVKDRFLKFAATFEAKLLSGNEELGNDMGKIIFMVKVATDSATDSVILTEESIKQLEADKEHLVSKKSSFHKALTLFPGGIALVESVAQVIQQYNKDKLHNVSVARIDELCKILDKVSGSDVVRDGVLVLAQESQESIWIELFAKVCDVTANSSRRFLEANKNTVLVSVGSREE